MAGNSIRSHFSPSLSRALLRILPVKSRLDHRVITITILPPGCKRCLGPDVYHSYTESKISGEEAANLASCSECGSSIINKSAPLPVTVPPTPIAKYSPLWFVDHLPAALLSCLRLTFGKTFAYCSDPTKFLTLRPKPVANSAVFEH